jgi:hypothetical protein
MPLLAEATWHYECAVCSATRSCRPGQYPDGWRRLTLRGARVTFLEDHVCSPACATAAVVRAWRPAGDGRNAA